MPLPPFLPLCDLAIVFQTTSNPSWCRNDGGSEDSCPSNFESASATSPPNFDNTKLLRVRQWNCHLFNGPWHCLWGNTFINASPPHSLFNMFGTLPKLIVLEQTIQDLLLKNAGGGRICPSARASDVKRLVNNYSINSIILQVRKRRGRLWPTLFKYPVFLSS